MKKLFISVLVLVFTSIVFLGQVQAQSRNVTVNLFLDDVLSSGGEGDGGTATGANEVNFEFLTEADYRLTKSQVISDQLRVLSTQNYDITVKALNPNFISPVSTLPLSILKLSTSPGGENTYGTAISPTTTEQTIFTNGVPTLAQSFDIKYEIEPNIALIEAAKELYSVELTFTVVAQ